MTKAIKPLDWDEWLGKQVRIYRNLNNGSMSIQGKLSQGWRVVGHVFDAVVMDVTFHIQEGGRQSVIRKGEKHIHAWGQGTLAAIAQDIYAPISLSYNPFTDSTFKERGTDHQIDRAKFLIVRQNLVYVTPDAIGGPPAQVVSFTSARSRKASGVGQLGLFNCLAA